MKPLPYGKILLVIVLAVILVVVILFMGGGTGPVIRVLGEDSSNLGAMEQLKDEYEELYGVRVEFVKRDFATAGQLAVQDLASKTAVYDIILQYNFSLSSFVRNNWVLNAEETKALVGDENKFGFESELFPNAWREVGYYGSGRGLNRQAVAIGYPFAANTMLLVYNKELFDSRRDEYEEKFQEKLEPPKDWSHFRRIAEFFTTKPPHSATRTYGVALQGGKDGWLYYEWCNFAFGMGGGVMKKDWGWDSDAQTQLLLTTKETIEATQLYMSLKPYTYGDFFAMGATEQQEAMRTNSVAMAIMWSDYVPGLIRGRDDETFGFAPIPGTKSMLAGGIYYINRESKHKKEAAQFVVHLMQKPTQVKLMKEGLCSGLRSAYEDPEVQKIPYARALRDSLARGVYMAEAGPDSQMIQEILTTYLQRIWKEEVSVETGLRVAQEEIRSKRADIYEKLKQDELQQAY